MNSFQKSSIQFNNSKQQLPINHLEKNNLLEIGQTTSFMELESPFTYKGGLLKKEIDLKKTKFNFDNLSLDCEENAITFLEKGYKFGEIQINLDNLIEQRIHAWLDQQNVFITDPNNKIADYYHKSRTYAFGVSILTPSKDQRKSMLTLSDSPILQRRLKTQEEDCKNSSFFKDHLDQEKEIVIQQFNHA